MSNIDVLLQKIAERRQRWVDLGGGRSVRFSLPTFVQRLEMAGKTGADLVVAALSLVDDWRGFTEADLIDDGDANAIVPFDKRLWLEVVGEHDDWVLTVFDSISAARQADDAQKEARAGN